MKVNEKSPYRIGLIGGGTDLPYFSNTYGTQIINAAFEAFTHCEISPIEKQLILLESVDYQRSLEIQMDPPFIQNSSIEFRIISAALDLFQNDISHLNHGLSIKTWSDFSPQSGLGGSSAHLITALRALSKFFNKNWTHLELLRTAIFIEREVLCIFGGYQDFYPCTMPGSHYIFKTKDGSIQNTSLDSEFLKHLNLDFYIYRPRFTQTSEKEFEIKQNLPSLDILKKQHSLGRRGADAWLSKNTDAFEKCLIESWNIKNSPSGSLIARKGILAAKNCGLSKHTQVLVAKKGSPELELTSDIFKIHWI